jgi:hypothetical protein
MVDMALTAVLRVVTTVDNGSEDGAKEVTFSLSSLHHMSKGCLTCHPKN